MQLTVIGIELPDTIKVYFRKHVIHVEVVMLVAIIAISRKIIVMDFDQYTGTQSLGIAAIAIALAGGYFLREIRDCLKAVGQIKGKRQNKQSGSFVPFFCYFRIF